MKAKCLFLFALLMTLTGSYKGEVKAASNFDVTTELLAFERNVTPPFFTKKPQDIIAVEGETVKITAKITGSQPITIKVYKDNVELKFSGRISLQNDFGIVEITIEDVRMEDAGEYRIVATNVAGTATTSCKLKVVKAE